jgi:hypothetical protein
MHSNGRIAFVRCPANLMASRRTTQPSLRESKYLVYNVFLLMGLNPVGRICFSYWSRCIPNCGPAVQQRFKSHMEMYLQAVHQQSCDRVDGTIPDLETYKLFRLYSSGCKPMFDLIEYSLDMELPEEVVEHPIIIAQNQNANQLVAWANVSATTLLFSTLPVLRKERVRIYSRTMSNRLGTTRITWSAF